MQSVGEFCDSIFEFLFGEMGEDGVWEEIAELDYEAVKADLAIRDLENQKMALNSAVARLRDMRRANFILGLDGEVQSLRNAENVIHDMCDRLDAIIQHIHNGNKAE